uniref:Conjugative transfer protein TraD n=1 Tax=Ascaris lumbricoides TaxID=6252 RepID=A0A0M3IA22_ASCLU
MEKTFAKTSLTRFQQRYEISFSGNFGAMQIICLTVTGISASVFFLVACLSAFFVVKGIELLCHKRFIAIRKKLRHTYSFRGISHPFPLYAISLNLFPTYCNLNCNICNLINIFKHFHSLQSTLQTVANEDGNKLRHEKIVYRRYMLYGNGSD